MGRSQSLPRGDDPRFGPDADDSGSPILHVDMDAFFAAVEVRRRPELRGRPVVVGGVGPRGVVSSASYEARQYGVRSAMPTSQARARCPHAVYLPPDSTAYTVASRAVMQIFRDVTPLVEPLSLDEAFLDVTGARRLFGSPATIARLIRRRVADEQALTCSVGVAPSKFVAKLGSTRAKPDGLLVVPPGQVLDFLHPLPVDALWGVGERAAEALRRLGLTTVGDLAEAPVSMLRRAVGAASATHLHELAWGRDPRRVSSEHVDKSIGAEVTFDVDVADPQEIRRTLLALSAKVGVRLRAPGRSVARSHSRSGWPTSAPSAAPAPSTCPPTPPARCSTRSGRSTPRWTQASGSDSSVSGWKGSPRRRAPTGSSPSARPSVAGAKRKLPRTPLLPVSGGPS